SRSLTMIAVRLPRATAMTSATTAASAPVSNPASRIWIISTSAATASRACATSASCLDSTSHSPPTSRRESVTAQTMPRLRITAAAQREEHGKVDEAGQQIHDAEAGHGAADEIVRDERVQTRQPGAKVIRVPEA